MDATNFGLLAVDPTRCPQTYIVRWPPFGSLTQIMVMQICRIAMVTIWSIGPNRVHNDLHVGGHDSGHWLLDHSQGISSQFLLPQMLGFADVVFPHVY